MWISFLSSNTKVTVVHNGDWDMKEMHTWLTVVFWLGSGMFRLGFGANVFDHWLCR